jgi:hypothetical protein
MAGWTLLPIMLLSPPAVKVRSIDLSLMLAVTFSLPLVIVVAAPVIAVAINYAGVSPVEAHARLLAAKTEGAWHQVTLQPLRFVGAISRTRWLHIRRTDPGRFLPAPFAATSPIRCMLTHTIGRARQENQRR